LDEEDDDDDYDDDDDEEDLFNGYDYINGQKGSNTNS